MWYYTANGATIGPVTFDAFQTAANSGQINRFADRAWCDALADWVAVSEIDGLFHSPPPPAANSLASAGPRAITSTGARSVGPAAPAKLVPITLMTVLFSVGIGLEAIAALLMLVGNLEREEGFLIGGIIIMIPAVGCLIWFMVLYLTAIYRLWDAIPEGSRRTTPGKAIGFLFIPVFGLYWIFQAYWGLAKDYNQWRQPSPPVPRLSEGLFLTHCILTVCQVIPLLNILAMVANLAIAFPLFRQVGKAVNSLGDRP